MANKCKSCGGPTVELFTSRVCKYECDKLALDKVAQTPEDIRDCTHRVKYTMDGNVIFCFTCGKRLN